MKDALVLGALLISFATLVTTHVAIAFRFLFTKNERWRALVVCLVPPLAPLLAVRKKWRGLSWLWVGSAVVYAIALMFAFRP